MVKVSFIQLLFNSIALLLALQAAGVPRAIASDDTYPGRELRQREREGSQELPQDNKALSFFSEPATAKLSPPEAFARARSVFEHLGAPEEADSQPQLDSLARRQNQAGLDAILAILDPTGAFKRFMRPPVGGLLTAFQDADGYQVPDFALSLASDQSEAPTDAASFHQRLLKARSNPPEQALAGLRIAIDPGHMGGAFWDRETGKAVHDPQGHRLSEGVLNLQVALLLEQAFKSLGAQVLLTHRELGPVSTLDYAKLDTHTFGLQYLRDESLVGWFQTLLSAGSAGSSALFAAADSNPAIKKALAQSDVNRAEYFILGQDLIARSEAINAFDADIALVIHFDTSSPAGDPAGLNPGRRDGTKAYVVGSYEPTELSSRGERALFAQHLLDATSWSASWQLGHDVLSHLHTDLKLTFDQGGGGVSRPVEPGLFSRNLGVSRRVTQRALTYIECLFYNDPVEFAALLDARHPMQISGESHPYSDRLIQVSQAIKQGVLDFTSHYGD